MIPKSQLRSQAETDTIIASLARKSYRPLLRDSANILLEATTGKMAPMGAADLSQMVAEMMAGRRPGYARRYAIGDIFFRDKSALLLQPLPSKVLIAEVRHHKTESLLREFAEAVSQSAQTALDGRRLRGMTWDWIEMTDEYLAKHGRYYRSARPTRIGQGTLSVRAADLNESDVALSTLLVDPEQRAFLLRLVQTGKARSRDASQGLDSAVATEFLDRGLIRREFLLTCRKDSSTLCTVQSREEIENEFGSKLTCSVCGRSFSEESITEILAAGKLAKPLIDGSHWMTVWVTDLLRQSGVDLSQVNWGATAGEDEIDIVIQFRNSKVFFELKDREFGLGDAYPFASRVERYGADFGVIISMVTVADEVKRFLNEQRDTTIWTLEGQEQIENRLPAILNEISRSLVLRDVAAAVAATELDLSPIMRRWMTA